jgi:hypothetical protein
MNKEVDSMQVKTFEEKHPVLTWIIYFILWAFLFIIATRLVEFLVKKGIIGI